MMDDRYILDQHGDPQPEPDLIKWAAWYETARNRQLCKTEAADGLRISTVFLGLNHQWGDGPPLLYETMIFGGEHDGYQERYATKDEAIKGHERAVALVASSENPPSQRGAIR